MTFSVVVRTCAGEPALKSSPQQSWRWPAHKGAMTLVVTSITSIHSSDLCGPSVSERLQRSRLLAERRRPLISSGLRRGAIRSSWTEKLSVCRHSFTQNEPIPGIEFLRGNEDLLDVIGVRRTAEQVSNHLKDVRESLSVVNIHIHCDAAIGARKEGQLQVPRLIESLEALISRKPGGRGVERRVDLMKH